MQTLVKAAGKQGVENMAAEKLQPEQLTCGNVSWCCGKEKV